MNSKTFHLKQTSEFKRKKHLLARITLFGQRVGEGWTINEEFRSIFSEALRFVPLRSRKEVACKWLGLPPEANGGPFFENIRDGVSTVPLRDKIACLTKIESDINCG